MKKILLMVMLLIGMINYSQVQFGDKEYFTFSVAVDPSATFKEESINIVTEIELVSYWGYVKAGVQVLPGLEGGYVDMTGGLGLNLSSGIFNTFRYYSGGRLGIIKRCGESYPLVGIEGGIDCNLTDNMFIGLRGTGDYRSDFEFWGGEAEMRYSGFIRVGLTF